MTGECLRYEKGGFQSGFRLSSRTNILQILMMALFWKYVAALPGLWRAHGKLHCFRRTTHSRSGDIQVGMGMSYRITRSGNLHSNALKSAPLFWAIPPSSKALFWSTQFSSFQDVLRYKHMTDSILLHLSVERSVMMGDKFSAGRTAGLATGDQCSTL